ncbi:MAG TPA: hypothetical protein VG346_07755 [Acidimicrobiales bacterium]|nr:hypothetical protein [Acidimicrobiales bacterium]
MPPRRASRRAGAWIPTVSAITVYAVLALLANGNAWMTGAAHALQGGQDPKLNVWTVAWTPFALTHGVSPLFSHWVNVPFGANDAANAAIPLLSLIASPITAIWGPVAGVNFLISFSFFACCVAGYFFVRHWTNWRPAAFAGGLLYGFSPYVVSEGNNHIHTMFVALIPFMFIVLDEILVRQRYSPRRLGVLLGLLAVLQYFISSELLATTVIVAAIAAVLVGLFNFRHVRAHVLGALPALGIALGIAVIVLAYPVVYSQEGPQHFTLILPGGQYQSDFLSAVIPTSNQVLAPAGATVISDRFANNLSENGSYLGIPLVMLLIGATVLCRRSRVVVVAFLVACAAYLLSLGSPLAFDNNYVNWLHLPGGVLHHLPLLEGAVTARFSLFVALFTALVLGVALEHLRRWPRWPSEFFGLETTTLVAAAVLLPLLPSLPYAVRTVDTPAFFTSSGVDSVPAGSVAVVYPSTTPTDADSTLWQAAAGMRFKMPGAYALVPAHGGTGSQWGTPTLTSNTLGNIVKGKKVAETTSLRGALRAQWRAWDAQTFIMGPGPHEAFAREFVSWAIGRPPVQRQGVDVWYRLQHDLASS